MDIQHPASSLSKNPAEPGRSPRVTGQIGSRNDAFCPAIQKVGFDPTRSKRQPVQYWSGPTWEVKHGQLVLILPGQPRSHALATRAEGEVKQAEARKTAANHADQTPATSPPAGLAEDTPPCQKPRKCRHAKPKAEAGPLPLESRRWLTIKTTAQRYPYTEGALRHLVFQAEQYAKHPKSGLKSNGFLACIVRPQGARRVLIDAEQLERWLQGQ
ncbi:hypothetical protein OKW45_006792 [Paraburkholderia sp. WSM4175]|uniref:hypothetical protein n=1 Tax=Paraburkholderia sp. WSM4175 TaxID=2991072 RepID=UPI003D21A10C